MEKTNGTSRTSCGKGVKASSRKPKYTHRDAQGMRWRFVGSRPVSKLADEMMKESGFELP